MTGISPDAATRTCRPSLLDTGETTVLNECVRGRVRSITWPGRRVRERLGRRLYGLLQRAGPVVAVTVRYEAAPAGEPAAASVPAAFTLDRWRADDDGLPAGAPSTLAAQDAVVVVALEGELVGICVLSPRADAGGDLAAAIDPGDVACWDLYVEPAYRGRGLGTALLRRARADALVADHGRVVALVAADNRRSRRTFRAAGFAPSDRLVSLEWGERSLQRRTALLGRDSQ